MSLDDFIVGMSDLNSDPDSVPAAVHNLLSSLRRCHVLLAAGASELATDKQLVKPCQV